MSANPLTLGDRAGLTRSSSAGSLVGMDMTIVSAAVRRVRVIVDCLAEAHALGIDPGTANDMTSVEYHASVLPIYRLTLSDGYLQAVAKIYADAFEVIDRANSSSEQSWRIVTTFLGSVSRVLETVEPEDRPLAELPSQPTPIIRYAELAKTVTPEAVTHLRSAVYEVLEFVDTQALEVGVLDSDQLDWFRRTAKNHRIIDIANDSGYSERSMYREFNQIWKLLGVENRAEGIAEAARRGLLA